MTQRKFVKKESFMLLVVAAMILCAVVWCYTTLYDIIRKLLTTKMTKTFDARKGSMIFNVIWPLSVYLQRGIHITAKLKDIYVIIKRCFMEQKSYHNIFHKIWGYMVVVHLGLVRADIFIISKQWQYIFEDYKIATKTEKG